MGSNKTAECDEPADPSARPDDQNELSLAISKAVTQVLESSDWRSLSFPLDSGSGRYSKAKNTIKRPMNAFMLYAQAARKKLSHLYPDLSYAKLSKTLGRIWKSLDDSEKQPFIDEAERLRQKHKMDYPDYKFQPKRKEKRRSHSPNKESFEFENGEISTGDVLKVLSSSGTSGNVIKHESQNIWARNIHNGVTPPVVSDHRAEADRPADGGVTHGSQLPVYSTAVNEPSLSSGAFPATSSPDLSRRSVQQPQHPLPSISQRPHTTATTANPTFQTRFLSPPSALHRSTTAGLFTPASYKFPKGHQTAITGTPAFPQMNDFHNFSSNSQTFPCDLSLAIGNSFVKCPPQGLNTYPSPLAASDELNQTSNLLTGVNQILKDMFGTDKNSVI